MPPGYRQCPEGCGREWQPHCKLVDGKWLVHYTRKRPVEECVAEWRAVRQEYRDHLGLADGARDFQVADALANAMDACRLARRLVRLGEEMDSPI